MGADSREERRWPSWGASTGLPHCIGSQAVNGIFYMKQHTLEAILPSWHRILGMVEMGKAQRRRPALQDELESGAVDCAVMKGHGVGGVQGVGVCDAKCGVWEFWRLAYGGVRTWGVGGVWPCLHHRVVVRTSLAARRAVAVMVRSTKVLVRTPQGPRYGERADGLDSGSQPVSSTRRERERACGEQRVRSERN